MTVVPIDKSGSSLPNGKMNGHANSVKDGDEEEDNAMIDAEFAARHSIKDRRHPQESYDETGELLDGRVIVHRPQVRGRSLMNLL